MIDEERAVLGEENIHDLERQYRGLVDRVYADGVEKGDRTGTGTWSSFGEQIEGPVRPYPLLTSKKVKFHNVMVELLWFLQGRTNVEWLHEHGVDIWDDWADEDGEVGPVYGHQWRWWAPHHELDEYGGTKYKSVDQIKTVINRIADDPNSRRHLVTAWNPSDLEDMNLPPCHVLFQFWVRPMGLEDRRDLVRWAVENGVRREWVEECRGETMDDVGDEAAMDRIGVPEYRLDCHLYQRSADLFIGVPYNIASYALLTRIIARTASQQLGAPSFAPGRLHVSYGDAHVYRNHDDAVEEMLANDPMEAPRIEIAGACRDVDDWTVDHFGLRSYDHRGFIGAPVAV